MIYNKLALVCPTDLLSCHALAFVYSFLTCYHFSCQTRLYLDSSVALLLLDFTSLLYLVKKVFSFSFNLKKS